MRMRTLMLSTIICTGLMAVSANAATLQPSSKWAVSKIASTKPNTESYCAMVRQFDGNFVLTLAKNKNEENSIALDFQKDMLTKGQSYDVKVSTDQGPSRNFNVKSMSGKAVVIRVGKDKEFNTALGQAKILGIAVDGKTYDFSMSDFTKGRSELNNCLADLGKGATEAETEVTDITAPIPTASGKNKDVIALQDENARLRSALESERQKFENRAMAQDENSSMASELQEKIKLLEQENKKLRKTGVGMASEAGAVAVAEVPSESVLKQMAALREDNAKLKAELATMNEKLAQTLQKTGGESEKIAAYEAQLKEANAKIDAAGQRVVDANKAIAALTAQLNAKQADTKVVDAQKELQQKLTEVTAQLADSSKKSLAAEERAKALEAQLAETKVSLEKSSANTQVSAAQNELQQKLTQATAQLDDATKKSLAAEERAKALEAQLAESKLALEQETAKVTAPKSDMTEIIKLQKQIAILTADNMGLKSSLESAKARPPVVADVTYAGKAQELQQDLDKMLIERNKLAQQVEELSSRKDKDLISVSSNNWDLEQATRRFNESEREVRRLGLEIERSRSQCMAEKKDIEQMLFDPAIATKEQISKLNKAQDEAEAAKSESAALRQQLASLGIAPVIAQRQDASALANINTAAGGPGVDAPAVKAVENAPVERQALAKSVATQVNPVVAQGGSLLSVEQLRGLLKQSQIPLQGDIKTVSQTARLASYSWDTGTLFGSAEQQPILAGNDYQRLSDAYLAKTKNRCRGQFAAVPLMNKDHGGAKISTYEIACVGGAGSASAALVFFSKDGAFTAIAHEGDLNAMDTAMDIRDNLVSSLLSNKLASK